MNNFLNYMNSSISQFYCTQVAVTGENCCMNPNFRSSRTLSSYVTSPCVRTLLLHSFACFSGYWHTWWYSNTHVLIHKKLRLLSSSAASADLRVTPWTLSAGFLLKWRKCIPQMCPWGKINLVKQYRRHARSHLSLGQRS